MMYLNSIFEVNMADLSDEYGEPVLEKLKEFVQKWEDFLEHEASNYGPEDMVGEMVVLGTAEQIRTQVANISDDEFKDELNRKLIKLPDGLTMGYAMIMFYSEFEEYIRDAIKLCRDELEGSDE